MSIQWKVPCSVCLICKNVLIKDGRPIHSPRPVHSTKLKARGQKTIHELLKEYGEVDILEGQLCRNDERKLRHLDRSVTDFRVKCMKTLAELGKRCSSNNPHSQSNVKKPRPLFRDADEDDIIVNKDQTSIPIPDRPETCIISMSQEIPEVVNKDQTCIPIPDRPCMSQEIPEVVNKDQTPIPIPDIAETCIISMSQEIPEVVNKDQTPIPIPDIAETCIISMSQEIPEGVNKDQTPIPIPDIAETCIISMSQEIPEVVNKDQTPIPIPDIAETCIISMSQEIPEVAINQHQKMKQMKVDNMTYQKRKQRNKEVLQLPQNNIKDQFETQKLQRQSQGQFSFSLRKSEETIDIETETEYIINDGFHTQDSCFGTTPSRDLTPFFNSNKSKKLRPILPKPVNLFPELATSSTVENTEGHSIDVDHSYKKKTMRGKKKENSRKRSTQTEKSVGFGIVEQIIESLCVPDRILSAEEASDLLSCLPNGKVSAVAECVLKIPILRDAVETMLLSSLSAPNAILTNRKNGKLSELMKGSFEDLKTFNWDGIVEEIWREFPLLAKVLISFAIPSTMAKGPMFGAIQKLIPKIGTVYGILAQARHNRLSKIQKVVNILLYESICDQKVFDRLHTIGLCLSYGHSLTILDRLGGHFKDEIIDAIKDNKRIRIVGDNINWYTGVHDVRKDSHGHMNHAFGSAIIVQHTCFDHLSPVRPQLRFIDCPVEVFMPNEQDWENIKTIYSRQMLEVVIRHLPAFSFLKSIQLETETEVVPGQKVINKVIPLPILYCNEQKYEDVVKIMDNYEAILGECFEKANAQLNSVHIGGDQLTRERFSGAKRLRIGGTTASERFSHLGPITFEFFHLLMNFVKLILQNLYDEASVQEIGTMRAEQARILRDNVNVNVNEHYDGDKDFICSFTDAYIAEAAMDFFGMDGPNSQPTRNKPPTTFQTESAKCAWARQTFKEVVERYVFNKTVDQTVEEEGPVFTVILASGETKTILLKRKSPPGDYVKNYGHKVLELGMLFKSILQLCKSPSRKTGLSLIKITMLVFKANNNLSKYAYECMRFLVHQKCSLSEKEAAEEFYGLFVNTKGRLDSHIPCDLQMEYIVKLVKKHLKHMFSNQTEKNVTARTSAITAMVEVSKNFDNKSQVIVRSKKHSDKDSKMDEVDMIKDLRNVRPFQFQSGRAHPTFPEIKSSLTESLDPADIRSWIEMQTLKWATEIGQ